jgi:hypothetical protein
MRVLQAAYVDACGVNKLGVDIVTSRMLGAFREHSATRQKFMGMIEKARRHKNFRPSHTPILVAMPVSKPPHTISTKVTVIDQPFTVAILVRS